MFVLPLEVSGTATDRYGIATTTILGPLAAVAGLFLVAFGGMAVRFALGEMAVRFALGEVRRRSSPVLVRQPTANNWAVPIWQAI